MIGRFSLLLALAMLVLPTSAAADSASEAKLQFELGSELYKQQRYTEAIDRFIASHRLAPNANVVQNIVQTFQFLERKIDAYNWNETYLDLVDAGPSRAQALERREALGKDVAVLDVQTEPPGATLFVDRDELGSLGISPRRMAVAAGTHLVKARLPQHEEASVSVEVGLGAVKPVTLRLLPHRGILHVSSTPSGASVRLEDGASELGRTPLQVELPAGDHRIVITLRGHQEQIKSASIQNRTQTRIAAVLSRLAGEVSVLTVRGNVPGASVFLDGRLQGLAPLTIPTIEPGSRRLEVRAKDRESWSVPVILEAGAATRVDYELVDPRDRPWPGWRWVGYGSGAALFAAGAVTGLIANKTRSDVEREPSSAGLDRLDAQNTTADVLMASGLLTLGITAVWDLLLSGPAPTSNGRVNLER
jgi:hypothetical protein